MGKNVSNNKLLKKSKDLEDELSRLRQLATVLIDRTDWYQNIFNNCPFGIIITDLDFKFQDANSAFLNMLHYPSFEKLKDSSLVKLIPEESQCKDTIKKKVIDELFEAGIIKENLTFKSANGSIIPVSFTACVAKDDKGAPLKIAGFVKDDSTESLLNKQLAKKDSEIKKLKKSLEKQKNLHKLLLEQTKKNQQDMENSIVLNVKQMVFPYIGKLQQTTKPTDIQNEYIELLKSQLSEIISPFYSELSSKYSNLTPMEFRIAGLVKDGRSTKSMARLLNLSSGTVEFHRNNLRKKLGLRNTKVSLRSYLRSMD